LQHIHIDLINKIDFLQLIGKKHCKWLKIPSEFTGILCQLSGAVLWNIVRKNGYEKLMFFVMGNWSPSTKNDFRAEEMIK